MKIEKITGPEAFDALPLESYHEIGCVNWPAEFPDKPRVRFAIAHTGTEILLRYLVDEPTALGLETRDNGRVWTDSCVEFFINFDESGYYNFEFNCIGAALLGFRKRLEVFEHAAPQIMALIGRRSSLGTQPFAEKPVEGGWRLDARIPAEAFFKHNINSFDGLSARGNFYKCGDNLARPHFLSWMPIRTPKPYFHNEEFFRELSFGE